MVTEEHDQSATDITDKLKTGKKVYKEFYRKFREQYLVAGKLMKDWEEHFRVEVPPDLTPQGCIELDKKLIEFHQEASYLKATAQANMKYVKATFDREYRAAFSRIVLQYQSVQEKPTRLPSRDTIAALAEEETSTLKDTLAHAEIELDFWKTVLDDLGNSRRVINDMTISLGIEAKALQNEKLLDRMTTPSTRRDYQE